MADGRTRFVGIATRPWARQTEHVTFTWQSWTMSSTSPYLSKSPDCAWTHLSLFLMIISFRFLQTVRLCQYTNDVTLRQSLMRSHPMCYFKSRCPRCFQTSSSVLKSFSHNEDHELPRDCFRNRRVCCDSVRGARSRPRT